MSNILNLYLHNWSLIPDGPTIETNTSILQPCIYQGIKAILKIPSIEEEMRGAKLMQWWNGVGAAKVLEADENAILLERVENFQGITLKKLVEQGFDIQATRIICQTARLLHASREEDITQLVSLNDWFRSLVDSTCFSNNILKESALIAKYLLATQTEMCVLHGDLHHENILYSDSKGWLAIDPKGLYGDRAFDFANVLCNPNKSTALKDGRLHRQLEIICRETDIEYSRMLDWVIAWAGLSAIWMEEDGLDANLPLEVGKLALSLKN